MLGLNSGRQEGTTGLLATNLDSPPAKRQKAGRGSGDLDSGPAFDLPSRSLIIPSLSNPRAPRKMPHAHGYSNAPASVNHCSYTGRWDFGCDLKPEPLPFPIKLPETAETK